MARPLAAAPPVASAPEGPAAPPVASPPEAPAAPPVASAPEGPAAIAPTWRVPSRAAAAWYWLRVARQVALRAARDAVDGSLRRHAAAPAGTAGPLLAEERSPLWTRVVGDDDEGGAGTEFALVAGKVHNLRLAARAFDGVVVGPGEVLSFWRQLGRPTRRRGYAIGREVREGCVVPTVAGGLCQLSNALVRCAAVAGLEVVERWGHTARPAAEPGEVDGRLDATVFWNYLDLRLRATRAFRLEVRLDAAELRVAIRSMGDGASRSAQTPARETSLAALSQATSRPGAIATTAGTARSAISLRRAAADSAPARGCLSCDETSCFRHRHRPRSPAPRGRTAFLLDGWTPELADWMARHEDAGDADWLLPWVRPARRRGGHWQPPAGAATGIAWLASLRRTSRLRRAAGEGGQRQAAVFAGQALIAHSHLARLRPEHTRLVVDQQLLLPLHDAGALGGRRYDVLMTALPAGALQSRLDAASRLRPDARSLVDFRIDADAARRERLALAGAGRVVTAHRDVARHLVASGIAAEAIEVLDWAMPPGPSPARPRRRRGDAPPVVGFPASALARKGAPELAEALRELGWPVLVLGTPAADPALWRGVEVGAGRYADDWPNAVDLVALPAWVEHAPRPLLRALACGLPVVATPACGLPADVGVFEVEPGDVAGLVVALRGAAAAGTSDGTAASTSAGTAASTAASTAAGTAASTAAAP